MRRIRNALGHGSVEVNVPPDLDYRKDEFEFEKRTTVRFIDENSKDKTDLFEIEMPIDDLYMLVKKFHGIVFSEIIGDQNV